MPELRPFRALRFDPDAVGELGRIVAPPYDVIGPAEHRALLARHPRNAVRLDLPLEEPGDAPDDRYRRAARTFAAWRSDGTLHKDRRPSIYVYEQTYRVPGEVGERAQRGFFARLRLEPLGPASGVRPHERTLSAPREDRYKLLRATGANMSPVVALYEDPSGQAGRVLETAVAASPEVDVVDDDGTRHRLWALADDGPAGEAVDQLLAAGGEQPLTIADGHHRYETALRYRDERRMTRSCETDPAYDFILALLLDTGQRLTVLPTHRIARGLDEGGASLVSDLSTLFDLTPASREELEERYGSPTGPGGEGRFGLWTRAGGHVLEARRPAFEPLLPSGSGALRALDVTLLQATLERVCQIDPASAAAGGRLTYTKSVLEAMAAVDDRTDGADAAFLLDPTPVAAIMAVAAAGDVMPQKSTYFYPKPLTGLLINPHEW